MTSQRRRALVVVAVAYLLLCVASGGRAFSGSDAGGKAATVKVMADTGSWRPDVGYWATAADPDGRFHPLAKTERFGDMWVQAATLPQVFATVPLYAAIGPLGLLVIPALGALLGAWSAGCIARNLGAPTGAWAVVAVGLGTPLLFYAADLWEHAPAIGCLLASLALLSAPRLGGARALLGGAFAGACVALRAEQALYIVSMGGAALAFTASRRLLAARWRPLAAAGAAGAAVLGANLAFQRSVLGVAAQSTRVAAQAGEAGAGAVDRVRDSGLTFFGLFDGSDARAILLGVVASLGLVALAVAARGRSRDAQRWGTAITVVSFGLRLASGTGFVPGTIPAAPLSPLGALDAAAPTPADGPAVLVAPIAVGALLAAPLVWVLSFRGDLLAQWGGRYTLSTGVLLTLVAAIRLERERPTLRGPLATLVGVTASVSVLGVVWHVQRARGVDAAIAAIDRVDPDVVVVSELPHLGREGGTRYGDRRWLLLGDVAEAPDLVRVLRAERVDRVDLVDLDSSEAPTALPGFGRAGERHVDYLGFDIRVTRYEAR